MNQQRINRRKVVIVGAGAVGSTYGYALAISGLAEQIVLIDRNEKLAQGQVLDLSHGQPFFPTVTIRVGNAGDYADAALIVITAGAAQKPGETRLELLQKNAAIMRSIIDEIRASGSSAVILVVSNPVDVMTHVAIEYADWPEGRIIGSGTVLDSARLRYMISQHCHVNVHNVHAYMLGEHGDSEFAAWSLAHIAGVKLDEYCPMCGQCDGWLEQRDAIEQQVRDSAYHIIDYKGATWFAVGLAMRLITGSILRDEQRVMTVSTRLDDAYGLDDVCLSVPCLVGAAGVERVIKCTLSDQEMQALHASAGVLKEAVEQAMG